jgi:hypothetical protein
MCVFSQQWLHQGKGGPDGPHVFFFHNIGCNKRKRGAQCRTLCFSFATFVVVRGRKGGCNPPPFFFFNKVARLSYLPCKLRWLKLNCIPSKLKWPRLGYLTDRLKWPMVHSYQVNVDNLS